MSLRPSETAERIQSSSPSSERNLEQRFQDVLRVGFQHCFKNGLRLGLSSDIGAIPKPSRRNLEGDQEDLAWKSIYSHLVGSISVIGGLRPLSSFRTPAELFQAVCFFIDPNIKVSGVHGTPLRDVADRALSESLFPYWALALATGNLKFDDGTRMITTSIGDSVLASVFDATEPGPGPVNTKEVQANTTWYMQTHGLGLHVDGKVKIIVSMYPVPTHAIDDMAQVVEQYEGKVPVVEIPDGPQSASSSSDDSSSSQSTKKYSGRDARTISVELKPAVMKALERIGTKNQDVVKLLEILGHSSRVDYLIPHFVQFMREQDFNADEVTFMNVRGVMWMGNEQVREELFHLQQIDDRMKQLFGDPDEDDTQYTKLEWHNFPHELMKALKEDLLTSATSALLTRSVLVGDVNLAWKEQNQESRKRETPHHLLKVLPRFVPDTEEEAYKRKMAKGSHYAGTPSRFGRGSGFEPEFQGLP